MNKSDKNIQTTLETENIKLAHEKNKLEDDISNLQDGLKFAEEQRNKLVNAKMQMTQELHVANSVIFTLESLLVKYITDKQQAQKQVES